MIESVTDKRIERKIKGATVMTGIGCLFAGLGGIITASGIAAAANTDDLSEKAGGTAGITIGAIFLAGGTAMLTIGIINLEKANKKADQLKLEIAPAPAISGLKLTLRF